MQIPSALTVLARVPWSIRYGVLCWALTTIGIAACSRLNQGELSNDQRQEFTTAFPYRILDEVLKRHVDDVGRVDYRALRANPEALRHYTGAVAEVGPARTPGLFPNIDHQTAYYINAYNALAIANVVSRETQLENLDSFFAKADFFKFTRTVVDGERMSLDHLEQGVIRPKLGELYAKAGRGRQFGRIHCALNCVSASCPILPAEAFFPERVDQQLERETRRFVLEKRNVLVDEDARTVTVSKIFEWYAEDLWNDDGEVIPVLVWINSYRPSDQQIDVGYTVQYRDYDWTINAQVYERPGVTISPPGG